MKTILGLVRPQSGTVLARRRRHHHHVHPAPHPRRHRLGAEARRVVRQMTVTENLLAGALHAPAPREITADIERMYEHFPRLAERRRQAAGTLSGGEQQMLAFARALMSRPG